MSWLLDGNEIEAAIVSVEAADRETEALLEQEAIAKAQLRHVVERLHFIKSNGAYLLLEEDVQQMRREAGLE